MKLAALTCAVLLVLAGLNRDPKLSRLSEQDWWILSTIIGAGVIFAVLAAGRRE